MKNTELYHSEVWKQDEELQKCLYTYMYKFESNIRAGAQRGCGISIHGDTQNSPGQGPEQPLL